MLPSTNQSLLVDADHHNNSQDISSFLHLLIVSLLQTLLELCRKLFIARLANWLQVELKELYPSYTSTHKHCRTECNDDALILTAKSTDTMTMNVTASNIIAYHCNNDTIWTLVKHAKCIKHNSRRLLLNMATASVNNNNCLTD